MSICPDIQRVTLWPLRMVATCVVLASLTQTASAIDPNRAISQYVHESWGSEQGFPKGPVYAITQTLDGYLWIGADEGLIRFDGSNFRLIRDTSGAFTVTSVLGLEADRKGCLWVRLQDLSILRYCNGRFDRPASTAWVDIFAMSQNSTGEPMVSRAEQGAYVFREGRFQILASAADLPRSPVTSLVETPDGGIYLGTRDAGLYRVDGGKVVSIRKGLPDLKVNCLLAAGANDLWIGTDNGIAHWNGMQFVPSGMPASAARFQALAMVKDRDGNVWVGTDSRGLLRLNSEGVASFNPGDNSSPQAITALFEGREGALWIGHADGIERLRDSAFVTFSNSEGLPADGSNPVYVDGSGRMWFPPASGGLWWSKESRHGRIMAGGLNDDVAYALEGGPGELWVGRRRGGLTRLALDGAAITAKTWTRADGLAQDSISSVYRSRDGTIWAGTLSAGVSRFRNGIFTNFTVADGLASNTVSAMTEDADGTMWFATPVGLSTWSVGRWTTYRTSAGLPSDDVNCLLVDSGGVLWAGTAAGLAYRAADTFHVPMGAPAVLREAVLGMAEDRYGSLWVSTSGHVLRVNRARLLQGILGDGDIREFGLADGLRGTEGVKRNRSVVADSAGRIWISLNRGISVVDPARVTRNSAPAIPHVQSISADGNLIPITGGNLIPGAVVRIPGGHRRITFSYSGLILSVPERVRYRYRLEGYDRGWSDPTSSSEAAYTNLPPRSYRFRVMATNAEGAWSSREASIAFEVAPLYWETWWFGLSVLAAIAAGIAALYRFRLRQATNKINLRFQERLAERTRIAQELHDTLLQGFLSASMQVHIAADRLPEDSSVKPALNRALELMRQVIDEGRNAVRGLRSSRTPSLDLEQSFASIQRELVATDPVSEHVAFRVVVDGERQPLHPLLRDEVYRIGREAVMNAFRHAQATKIELELRYSPRRLTVTIRDDGRGIDPRILTTGRDGHWGLVGMRERADRIGAQFHVMSSASAGTEIELSIPAKIVFQNGKVK